MKEREARGVLFSCLLVLCLGNHVLVVATAKSIPSPSASPWRHGPLSPTLQPTPSTDDEQHFPTSRQKKVRKVKKPKRKRQSGSTSETVDPCDDRADDQSREEQPDDVASAADDPAREAPATGEKGNKKRRKVKIKRRHRTQDARQESATIASDEPNDSKVEAAACADGSTTTMDPERSDGLGRKRRRRKGKAKRNHASPSGENVSSLHETETTRVVSMKSSSMQDSEAQGPKLAPEPSLTASKVNLEAEQDHRVDEENLGDRNAEEACKSPSTCQEGNNVPADKGSSVANDAQTKSDAQTPGVVGDDEDYSRQRTPSVEVGVNVDNADVDIDIVESDVVRAKVTFKDEIANETTFGDSDPEDKGSQEVSVSLHETFEREVARVDDDYVPNLAEFDTSASEEEESEGLASGTSVQSIVTSTRDEDSRSDGFRADSVEKEEPTRVEQDVQHKSDRVVEQPATHDSEIHDDQSLSDEADNIPEDRSVTSPTDATSTVNDEDLNAGAQPQTIDALDDEGPRELTEERVDNETTAHQGDGEKEQTNENEAEVSRSISVSDNRIATFMTTAGYEQALISEVASVAEAGSEIPTAEPTSPAIPFTREILKLEHLDDDGEDDSDLTVSIVTWNLAEESPSEEEASFLRKFRDYPRIGTNASNPLNKGSDIVLVSGQECENTKPRRAEGHRSREFRRLAIKMLGREYVPLAIHSLGGVQFCLFCKRSILREIESVSVADVACGIGNVFHNKGAIAAFVQMKARDRLANLTAANDDAAASTSLARAKSIRMLFVTAHMAAHVKNIEARNMDYWRIASELEDQAPPRFLPPRPGRSSLVEETGAAEDGSGSFLMDSVDRVFFCGDLNYRVDLPREEAESTVKALSECAQQQNDTTTNESSRNMESLREKLLLHDQLLQTLADERAFPGFTEGKITFLPTFKFDKSTKDYDTSHKQRIPAWTDRILFKPFGVRVLEYSSVEDATHSDHRPVFGQFRVNMQGRELPPTRRRRSKRDKGE